LAHDLGHGHALGLLGATTVESEDAAGDRCKVSGCLILGKGREFDAPSAGPLPEKLGRIADLASQDAHRHTSVRDTETRDAGSCVERGYHIWEFDFVPPGSAAGSPVRGRCNGCGLEVWQRTGKHHSQWPKKHRGRAHEVAAVDRVPHTPLP